MYTNKIPLALLFCMILNISSNLAKPVPDDGSDDSEINIGIDAERIGTYVDGSWKDKYEDELDGYDSKQSPNLSLSYNIMHRPPGKPKNQK